MSDYTLSIEDAQNLVNDLIDAGWNPPKIKGNHRESDLRLRYAEMLQKSVNPYMPTYYPEGGGP